MSVRFRCIDYLHWYRTPSRVQRGRFRDDPLCGDGGNGECRLARSIDCPVNFRFRICSDCYRPPHLHQESRIKALSLHTAMVFLYLSAWALCFAIATTSIGVINGRFDQASLSPHLRGRRGARMAFWAGVLVVASAACLLIWGGLHLKWYSLEHIK